MASQSEPRSSFRETYRQWQILCRSKSADKEGWSRVIRSFSRIAKESSDPSEKKQSRFFAGKAALSLYERSGRVVDLETAISHLTAYARVAGGASPSSGPREVRRLPKPPSRPSPGETARPVAGLKRSGTPRVAPASTKSWHRAAGNALPGSLPGNVGRSKAKASLSRPEPSTVPVQQGNPFWPGPRPAYHKPSQPVERISVRAPAPAAAAPAKQTRPAVRRTFTVVIDPGHGGRDPGAVSRDGKVNEKDVTLGIARRMKQALEKQSDRVKVVLTRTGDTTMSLQSRTEFANSLKADLFISIHCNSIDDTVSKGIETFYLSPASCRKSMELAAKENGVSVSKMNEVQAVLLDLATTSKKTESDKLARIIQHSIISRLGGPQASSVDRGVRQAPFHVLLGARMPAVLVECAFISNPREKKKLQDPDYLNKLALGMAEGAIKYVTGAASMESPVVTVRRDRRF